MAKVVRQAFQGKAWLLLAAFSLLAPAAWAEGPIDATIADVKAKWPTLQHASPADVQKLIDNGSAVVFDVRSKEEQAVSHIPGAVFVDPAMSREAFIAQHGAALKGKTPVFYCAAGVRSSKMADRVGEQALAAAGAKTPAVSLAGGIYQWKWEARPLVDAKGPTADVMGYNPKWAQAPK